MQINARTIADDLNNAGMTSLMTGAARGVYTLPGTIGEDYAELQAVLEANSDRFGNIQGWQAEKEVTNLVSKMWSAIYGPAADAVIHDHITPGLKRYLDRFRADLDKAGEHAAHTDAGAVLSQPDDVRQAWISLTDSNADYHLLRQAWETCRKRNAFDYTGTGTIDPGGLTSPLAEVANFPDIVPDWQLAAAGRKPWPWHGTAHHVRFAWLLSNGADIWLPTGYEQNQVWAKYNPSRRVAA